jgi:MFS family permease
VIFPPYSEAFGRKWVYIAASLVYCLACTVSGVTPHIAGVVVGRFVAGFVSAVPSIIVSGSIEDMFNMTQRVWIMYAWACATTGGLLVGPIYGSYISGSLGWHVPLLKKPGFSTDKHLRRWAFYIAAMITGVLAMLLSFIKESRASKLLAKRLDLVRKKTGITHFRITNPDYTPDIQTFVKVALRRPVRLFFTDPIVTIVSIMSAVGWALIYLLTEALPVIYGTYGLTWSQSSLLFLIIGGGIFFGIFPRLHDHRLLQRRAKQDLPLHPEDKLLGFAVAAPSLAIGLWWLALTASPASTLPWYATLPALVPIGFATNEFACTLSGYLADTYTIYASSAFAAMSFLRAVLGGLFPLIGRSMYESLGSNWASVILAGVATIFCITPVLFRRYGMRIRKRSKFAKYSLSINRATQIHDDHME